MEEWHLLTTLLERLSCRSKKQQHARPGHAHPFTPPPICNLAPRLFIASVVLLVSFLGVPSAAPAADKAATTSKVADPAATAAKPDTAASTAKTPTEKIIGDADTHVIVDTEHHVVRIVIDGREVARFDAGGMSVPEGMVRMRHVKSAGHGGAAQPMKRPAGMGDKKVEKEQEGKK